MATAMEMELRERLSRLEQDVKHLSKTLETSNELVRDLHDAFNQAKGAKWAFYAVAGAVGFVGSKAGAFLASVAGFLPR
jgi:hypothetical protein